MFDLAFSDWGTAATLVVVTETFDPVTGAVAASSIEFPITVIQSPVQETLVPDAAGMLATASLTLLMRQADWPTSAPATTCRVHIAGTTWWIQTASASADQELLILHAIRR